MDLLHPRVVEYLGELARHHAAAVFVSLTTLDEDLARTMEPRTATPSRRLDAIRQLSEAGIPVGVLMGPLVPGLTDHEMPRILEAAAEAGAVSAGYVPLRLPHAVKDLFADWLEAHFPDRKERVLNRVRDVRAGALNDSRFGSRMRGEGPYADGLAQLFRAARRKAGLETERVPLSAAAFRRPAANGQLSLFG